MKKFEIVALIACAILIASVFFMSVDKWIASFIFGITILVLDILYAIGFFPEDDVLDPRHWTHFLFARIMHFICGIVFWIAGIVIPVSCLIHWFG